MLGPELGGVRSSLGPSGVGGGPAGPPHQTPHMIPSHFKGLMPQFVSTFFIVLWFFNFQVLMIYLFDSYGFGLWEVRLLVVCDKLSSMNDKVYFLRTG